MKEFRRIIEESEIARYSAPIHADYCSFFREDDKLWPLPDKEGRQELEIVMEDEHINFVVQSHVARVILIYF